MQFRRTAILIGLKQSDSKLLHAIDSSKVGSEAAFAVQKTPYALKLLSIEVHVKCQTVCTCEVSDCQYL